MEDLIETLLELIGACVRWLFFLGKKSLKVLLEQEMLNTLIGFAVAIPLIIFLIYRLWHFVTGFFH
jgi:hypothetical protein